MPIEYAQQPEPRPHPHSQLALQIAEYLHTAGVTRSPLEDQGGAGLPSVFGGGWEDQPDVAVAVLGVTVDHTFDSANPKARFTLAHRAEPHDLLGAEALAGETFTALHDLMELRLTAEQRLLSCTRIVANPALQDSNRRWVRLDTYEAILAVPTT